MQTVCFKHFPELYHYLKINKFSKPQYQIYNASLLSAVNKPKESNLVIEKVSKYNKSVFTDSLYFYLLRVEYDNYVKLYDLLILTKR